VPEPVCDRIAQRQHKLMNTSEQAAQEAGQVGKERAGTVSGSAPRGSDAQIIQFGCHNDGRADVKITVHNDAVTRVQGLG
jgi:hypothetical protein